jgi:excisionase family DNA binding protein
MNISVELDEHSAGQLAAAVALLGSRARKEGCVWPAALTVIQGALEHRVQSAEPMVITISDGPAGSCGLDCGSIAASPDHAEGDDSPGYLSRGDAARIAGVSLDTLDRWVSRGDLASTKVGRQRRIRRQDLDRFLGPMAEAGARNGC